MMMRLDIKSILRSGLAFALTAAVADVHAAETENTLKVGYAHIGFNTKSGDLTGPAGTTPPGVKADLKSTASMAFVYERHITGPWSLLLQVGTPPVIKLFGAGSGSSLGQVGTTRAWFPAALAQYTFDGPFGLQPYLGAGFNRTVFTDGQVSAAYTGAFGGTSSRAKMDSSWGHVWKIGMGIPLGDSWIVDAAYCRYAIRTTATITTSTPGFGEIVRTLGVKADPDVFALTMGYRF